MKPLAQDYVVAARSPDPETYVYEPSLTVLPGGGLLGTYEYMAVSDDLTGGKQNSWFRLCLSRDEGRTWKELPPLDLHSGMPFVHNDELYMLGHRIGRRDIVILHSADEADSWSEPVTLFTGIYWNAPAGIAIRDGFLYRAFGCPAADNAGDIRWTHSAVIAGDLSRDLTAPDAWRMSEKAVYPGTPGELHRGICPDVPDTCLEPNVVNINRKLRVLLRIRIDGQNTAGMCAVNDLDDDGVNLDYRFGQLYPMPLGHNKFHILYDAPSGLFWACGSMVTDTANPIDGRLRARGYDGAGGNERRLLMLCCSLDAHNWFQAGCIAMSRDPLEAFNYPAPAVFGDDLLVLSRTTKGRAVNQAKSNLITFHRIRNFRSLALDIKPDV